MDRSKLPRDLRPFVDDHGRLCQWPARHKVQRMSVALLAQRFESGREYHEKEVNALLMDGHTFADWAIIRRSLVDWGFMSRVADGSRYWLNEDATERIARELATATLDGADARRVTGAAAARLDTAPTRAPHDPESGA